MVMELPPKGLNCGRANEWSIYCLVQFCWMTIHLLLVCFVVSLNFSFCLDVNSCEGIQTRISYFLCRFLSICLFIIVVVVVVTSAIFLFQFFYFSFVMICWRWCSCCWSSMPTKSDERWLMLVCLDFNVWRTIGRRARAVTYASHTIHPISIVCFTCLGLNTIANSCHFDTNASTCT